MEQPPSTTDLWSPDAVPTIMDWNNDDERCDHDVLLCEGSNHSSSDDDDDHHHHHHEDLAPRTRSSSASQGHQDFHDEGNPCIEQIPCESKEFSPSIVSVTDLVDHVHAEQQHDHVSISPSDLDLISESDLIVGPHQRVCYPRIDTSTNHTTDQTFPPLPWASSSSRTCDDDVDDVLSDMAVEPFDSDEEDHCSDEGTDASCSSSLSKHKHRHHKADEVGGSDNQVEDGHQDNVSSSSSFTHDEWWDWLDNLTVAFIEINDDSLSDDPNDHHNNRSTTNKSKTSNPPLYPNLYHHTNKPNTINTSTELTIPNTSYDGTTERETEEPSSSWDVTMVSMGEEEEEEVEMDHRISHGTSHAKGTWDLIDPSFPAELASLAPSDELLVDDPSNHRWPYELMIPSRPPLALRQSASLADFRSVAEQQQSRPEQQVLLSPNRKVLRMSRSASFKDLLTTTTTTHETTRLSDMGNVGSQQVQLRRITSNENLLLTLKTQQQQRRNPSRTANRRESLEGMMVCFAPASTKSLRTRMSRLVAIAVAIMVVVAILSRALLPFQIFSSSDSDMMMLEAMCPPPRVVHLDWEHASYAATREVQYVWDQSMEIMSDAYRKVSEHIPSTHYHPRVVRLDLEAYASTVVQDANAMLNASKHFMAGTYHTVNDKVSVSQIQHGLDSIRKTVRGLHDAILVKLNDLCISENSTAASLCSCLSHLLPDSQQSSLWQRLHLHEAVDLVVNETSAFVSALQAMWQYQLYGIVKRNKTECMLRSHEDLPYAVKALSNFTPIVAPSTVLRDNYRSNLMTRNTTLHKASQEPRVSKLPLSSNFTAFASLPLRFGTTRNLRSSVGKAIPSNSKSAQPPRSNREIRKRVQGIVSRLEAHGRLQELERLLVARFGSDENNAAGRPTKLPLLGKYREEHLRELWLRNMEREIVLSTFGERLNDKDVLWRSFKRRFESLVANVNKSVRRWNLVQLIEEIRTMTINGTALNDLWILDIGQVLRSNKTGKRHATGIARFEWLNELWSINDADVVRELTHTKSLW